jgi:ArsR family transcriptional regulator
MKTVAALFKVLSDPTRLRLTALLANQEEICVCGLAEALNDPEFKISRHLSILRSAGLVATRREGTWMYYRLADARSNLEKGLQACLRESLRGHPTLRQDLARFAKAAPRLNCRITRVRAKSFKGRRNQAENKIMRQVTKGRN